VIFSGSTHLERTIIGQRISVIILTLNSKSTIPACLDSILSQDYQNPEIIVVDGGSTDSTIEIIRRYPVKVLIENAKDRSIPHARNVGINAASGSIIVFIDSDCVAEKNCLSALVKHFDREEVAGVGGQIFYCRSLIKKENPMTVSSIFPPYSPPIAYRKKHLERIGGFDETLPYGEDWDLYVRVRLAGYKVIYEPKAIVYHRLRSTKQMVKLMFYRSQSNVLRMYWKHKDLLLGIKKRSKIVSENGEILGVWLYRAHLLTSFCYVSFLILFATFVIKFMLWEAVTVISLVQILTLSSIMYLIRRYSLNLALSYTLNLTLIYQINMLMTSVGICRMTFRFVCIQLLKRVGRR